MHQGYSFTIDGNSKNCPVSEYIPLSFSVGRKAPFFMPLEPYFIHTRIFSDAFEFGSLVNTPCFSHALKVWNITILFFFLLRCFKFSD